MNFPSSNLNSDALFLRLIIPSFLGLYHCNFLKQNESPESREISTGVHNFFTEPDTLTELP